MRNAYIPSEYVELWSIVWKTTKNNAAEFQVNRNLQRQERHDWAAATRRPAGRYGGQRDSDRSDRSRFV